MNAKTTKETLVRTVVYTAPDGTSVSRTEAIEVEITWPGERPEDLQGHFTMHGSWTVATHGGVLPNRERG